MTRAELIERLDELGLPSLGPHSINILMPWLAATGEVLGLADGSFRRGRSAAARRRRRGARDPRPPLPRRLRPRRSRGPRPLVGPADHGLPPGPGRSRRRRRRPAAACSRCRDPPAAEPRPPPVILLGAFDTSMLGWRTREPLVAAADDAGSSPAGASSGPSSSPRRPGDRHLEARRFRARGAGSLRLVRRPPAPPALRRRDRRRRRAGSASSSSPLPGRLLDLPIR